MSITKMENKFTRSLISSAYRGKYTLTVPTLIKHVSIPSYEPEFYLAINERRPEKKKKKN